MDFISINGKLELGTEAPAGEPDIAFEGATPITPIEYAGRRLPAVLDTGAGMTQLWPKCWIAPAAGRFRSARQRCF